MSDISFELEDNSDEFLKQLAMQIERTLEACGLQAERFAKQYCPVDTGRLRNSITHALAGHGAAIKGYKADRPRGNDPGTGSYSGNAPDDPDSEMSVYIGTNVEYAEKIEHGGSKQAPEGYLLRALRDHQKAYEKIFSTYLKDASAGFGDD